MKQSNIPSAQAVVSACRATGIKNIIISPGSRNAPLTITFTEDSFFNCFSIVDERSAAFFALGIALQQKLPTALVCTSGSALLNYYPAIAEAFYSTIPLVVISADRPPYKIDVGDGQTIRQDNVFNRHIGYSANLKLDVSHAQKRLKLYAPDLLSKEQKDINAYNKREITQALNVVFQKKLPAHINVPFEEPLYDVEVINEEVGFTQVLSETFEFIEEGVLSDIDSYKKLWRTAKKKMVLIGVNHPNEVEQELLDILGNDPSVLVFTETTSNLHHPNFFPSIDSVIFPIEKSDNSDTLFKELQPEILLTFGGLVVSKKIKAFLRNYKPKHHWHVDEVKAYDTYFSLEHHFKTNPNKFLKFLLFKNENVKSKYFDTWNSVKNDYERKRESYLKGIPFSDFSVFNQILKEIPNTYQVHLANSSTVRYSQLFNLNPSLRVFCNRGTSGIDGSTSTAVGAAVYEETPTLIITGDLSFFYDSNALWNNYIKNNFRIILINNSGGGIFRILPGAEDSENFSTFFETKHRTNAEFLCKQFGFEYTCAKDEDALKKAFLDFYDSSKAPKLLEIFTPRKLNDKILLGYFDFIS
ncbi:2-succinyl-5-enolpyruvyl-6-hydroxy-3-cyclohexene- 1-carboxylic-acid synthase [Croceitalea sp. MTPC9]|uniref:2-succinyl-5-enolpyruvyl-6-hydroxy-3- cyclohexene-1-carboxylic-acid synthase n=1 Tax=unclassified Croceitalea TaxID=2632280 RepID=UPI002B3BDDE4|nr:2-succinyl-5-enolpyruvyl-6-hydroxy-3-cyclohexene- 1-carboxylic-acid synthase [Croceitalea sp. MTPC6]GMN15899.1 2-succinyl-5-enolpyruvyl-6-hydroxy-3-cyclohexene- 1-carboxylic-acid synthase [Croceitalea sp. MTPC9]